MPPKKPRKLETFDDYLAAVIDARITKRGRRYDEVAKHSRIPLSNFSRRMQGKIAFTANEVARVGAYLDFDAAEMLEEALRDFGGAGRLLSEVRHNNEPPESPEVGDLDDSLDNVTQLSRKDSKEVDTERQAAHRRNKDQGE